MLKKNKKKESFKDSQGRIWTACNSCKKGVNGTNNCVYGARSKTKGFCIYGKLRKKVMSK
jgi:IS1 family transposase